jgi:GNAT superfamily N-acetyltransferase
LHLQVAQVLQKQGESTMQHQANGHTHERRRKYQLSRYPTSLIDVWGAKNGARLTLRPVLPQDDGLLGNMILGLSRATRTNRFHGAVNALSDEALQQMTCIDYRRHMAFVITAHEDHRERVVADARFVVDERGDGAEFAIVVDDHWQRLGLGERAIGALATAADRQGLYWLHGSVLSGNAPMLSLVQRCDFSCTPDHNEEHLVCIERRLSSHAPKRETPPRRYWPPSWLSLRHGPAGSSLPTQHEAR